MEDFLGNKISLEDTVVYIKGMRVGSSTIRKVLFKGIVKGFNNKTLKIKRTYNIEGFETGVFDNISSKDVTIIGTQVIEKPIKEPSKKVKAVKISKEDFDVIWQIYPRKEGKKKSLESINRALKDGASVEDIRIGTMGYKRYVEENKVEPRYIKMGSTFFNQDIWQDYAEAEKVELEKIRKEREEFKLKVEKNKKEIEKEFEEESKSIVLTDEQQLSNIKMYRETLGWGKERILGLNIFKPELVEQVYSL